MERGRGEDDKGSGNQQPASGGFADPGPERQVSVMNALTELMKEETAENSYVMVHDGARPLVSGELIRRCFEAAAGRMGRFRCCR